MPPIFGRSDPHPYEPVVQEWLKALPITYPAMACNIMHDHRISKERAEAFDACTNRPRTGSDLCDAIIRYKELYVKTARYPHFLDETLNGDNIITGMHRGSISGPHFEAQLVRILDLTGLTPVFQLAKRKNYPVFVSFPTRPIEPDISRWLERMIQQLGKKDFVTACLDALNDYSLSLPFHPTWAVLWEKFKPFVELGADRWLQLMGMPKLSGGRRLILLCYTVREAGNLIRPTQLDAGWFPHHFPSPPQAKLQIGGHPMDLHDAEHPGKPLSEFIHQQIEHKIEHWIEAGEMLEQTSGPTVDRLQDQRTNHHRRLIREYGEDVSRWMPTSI